MNYEEIRNIILEPGFETIELPDEDDQICRYNCEDDLEPSDLIECAKKIDHWSYYNTFDSDAVNVFNDEYEAASIDGELENVKEQFTEQFIGYLKKVSEVVDWVRRENYRISSRHIDPDKDLVLTDGQQERINLVTLMHPENSYKAALLGVWYDYLRDINNYIYGVVISKGYEPGGMKTHAVYRKFKNELQIEQLMETAMRQAYYLRESAAFYQELNKEGD